MNQTAKIVGALVGVVAVFMIGRWSGNSSGSESAHDMHASREMDHAGEPTLWTCPMHPDIRLPDPGPCPICGMDLVSMASSGSDSPRQLVMSPHARALAEIESAPVVRKPVTLPVRMVGKIDYDETAVRSIAAWVPGRLDRLFVDYTGVRVQAGDHLVWLYSPELSNAQEELIAAKARMAATANESSEFLALSNERAYRAAREKLVLWGLTESQVDEIEERGTAEDHMMLTSPASGVVIRKDVDQGAYVETGTTIYSIADLSHLWVLLDAYEQDLPWIRYGQEISLEAEALPGETFDGRISFIDPVVNERTRTVKVRVNIDNADGRLKPGMFARAVAFAQLDAQGVVRDRSLAGKWISPMHPEIVKDGPGDCDVCGMDLVPAEELGLVAHTEGSALEPLVVPASAVLLTGKRAIVYVDVPDAGSPTYEGREVLLGPRAGEYYLVYSGLEEGERVVVHGAFRIDSSMQIRAKPSMMSLELGLPPSPELASFRASLQPLYDLYFAMGSALARDDLEGALAAHRDLRAARGQIVADELPDPARAVWAQHSHAFEHALEEPPELEAVRALFRELSATFLELEARIGHAGQRTYFEVFCPMAFDGQGARWMQASDEVSNPYYGASMLRCGSVERALAPR